MDIEILVAKLNSYYNFGVISKLRQLLVRELIHIEKFDEYVTRFHFSGYGGRRIHF